MAKDDKPNGQPAPNARALAAQARVESEAAERRRERMIRIGGAVVVVLVVAGLLAVGFFAGRDNGTDAGAAPTADPAAALPAGVDPGSYGVPYGTGWTADNAASLPTLEIFEDFQCPGCRQLEASVGEDIQQLAEDGDVKLLYRPATFLDRNFPESNNSSARAAAAWGCAVDAGRTAEYHNGIYAMQPETEGQGYTEQQLLDLGAQVGITGEQYTTFESCVKDGTYLSWTANSQQAFEQAGIASTPTVRLNGTDLSIEDVYDIVTLKKLIAGATAS